MAKKIRSIIVLTILIGMFVLLKIFLSGRIQSIEGFRNIINQRGIVGPVLLTVLQALQVVIPVLPGYLGCAVGAISFGPWTGFLCNYIGISLGSIIAFLLAEKYGKQLVIDLFSVSQYEKWKRRIEKVKSYDRFLFIATLLPAFPDDFLCYFSGMIAMNRAKFIKIIILGKPWCILAYSMVFGLTWKGTR